MIPMKENIWRSGVVIKYCVEHQVNNWCKSLRLQSLEQYTFHQKFPFRNNLKSQRTIALSASEHRKLHSKLSNQTRKYKSLLRIARRGLPDTYSRAPFPPPHLGPSTPKVTLSSPQDNTTSPLSLNLNILFHFGTKQTYHTLSRRLLYPPSAFRP